MASSLADTSKTVGQTVLDVTSIIEHAVRRCGVSASIITAEQQQSARENLFLILSNLATKGLKLWCIQKLTIALEVERVEYALPVGTVDVLTALYRRATRYESSTGAAGSNSITLAAADKIFSVTVALPTAGRYDLVLEYLDGATWTSVGSLTLQNSPGTSYGFDATKLVSATDWRVRDTYDPTRTFGAAVFMSNVYDTEISKLSRDNYVLLPNKTSTSQWPLQFWYDKEFSQPRMIMWPVPSEASAMRVYTQRQVQDPGSYVNAVEAPQRWLDAVIALLAPRVCLELPAQLVPPGRYELLDNLAVRAEADAAGSESDGAPITLAPRIGGYTA